jgi:hypothetical protein
MNCLFNTSTFETDAMGLLLRLSTGRRSVSTLVLLTLAWPLCR